MSKREDILVLFDYGGIIQSNDYDIDYTWKQVTMDSLRYALNAGLSVQDNELLKTFQKTEWCKVCAELSFEDGTYKDILSKSLEQTASKLEIGYPLSAVEDYLGYYRNRVKHCTNNYDMLEYEHEVSGKCRVGILSDLSVPDAEYLRSFIGVEHYEALYLSCEMGLSKRRGDIYGKVEEMSGLSGDRILLVDDLDENIKAAKKLGWTTVKHDWNNITPTILRVDRFIKRT